MSKLPKVLSSIRARSTSLSNRTQDWQHRTTERSGSRIIAAMMDSGPREPNTTEDQTVMIIAKIKRETGRIAKAKAFGTPPIGRETQETKDRVAYILRKEAVVNRLYFLLQELNASKVRIDAREIHKFQHNPKSGEFVGQSEDFVRLEKNKIVPRKKTVLIEHRNAPKAHALKVKSMAQLVREEKLKRKTFPPAIQAEVEKVFGPTEAISEDEFEKMMNGN